MTSSIEQKLEELTKSMARTGYKAFEIRRVKELVDALQRNGVKGIHKFVQLLIARVRSRQEYLDICVEGRFAVILGRNGFSQIHMKSSQQGFDIKANYNRQTVYFEVTRRRPNEEDNWEKSTADFATSDSAQDIISKIQGELRQFADGETNVVVYWSSTIRVSDTELADAFTYIQQEIGADSQRYQKLSGILFTDGGVNHSTLKQFYLFKNSKAAKPLGIRLTSSR
jgi:hypothetical protein